MDYQSIVTFVMEMAGSVAFAASGAMVGVERNMDIFGVSVLGVATAVGGGMIRDIVLGIIPPAVFTNPVYALVSVLASCIVFFIFYKPIIYSSFDENFYNIYGVPVRFINYLLIILISSAIIINIKTIGIILIISILTIPQATASLLVKKYYLIIIFSGIFSFLGILSGLYFSYSLNIPSGPAIILSLTIILLFTKGFRKIFLKTT